MKISRALRIATAVALAVVLTPVWSPSATAAAPADSEQRTFFTQATLLTDLNPAATYPYAAAMSRDGSQLFYVNWRARSLVVVDTATRAVRTITGVGPTGSWTPTALEVSPDGGTVYLATNAGLIWIVDVPTGAVSGPYNPSGKTGTGSISAIALSPDGMTLYAASSNPTSGVVFPVNTATGAAGTPLTGLPTYGSMLLSPDGTTLYSCAGTSVKAADVVTGHITTLSLYCSSLAISADGSTLYNTYVNGSSSTLSAIDTATMLRTGYLGGASTSGPLLGLGGVPSPDGSVLYTSGAADASTLKAVLPPTPGKNPVAASVVASAAVDLAQSEIFVSPDGTSVYVFSRATTSLTVLRWIHAPTITSPAADAVVRSSTVAITGASSVGGSVGDTVDVTVEGASGDEAATCTAVVDADLSFTCSVALPDGRYTVSATQTTPGHTGSVTSPVSAMTTFDVITPPVITSPVDGETTGELPTIAGTGTPGDTVTVISPDRGPETVCTALVQSDATWSCTPTSAFPTGSSRLTATQTDGFGNISDLSATVTITVPEPGHTVIFDPNAPSSEVTGSMEPQTDDAPAELKPEAFTRAGYTFTGWSTDPEGTGIDYVDHAVYDFTADVTLYAQWAAEPESGGDTSDVAPDVTPDLTLASTGVTVLPWLPVAAVGVLGAGVVGIVGARRRRHD